MLPYSGRVGGGGASTLLCYVTDEQKLLQTWSKGLCAVCMGGTFQATTGFQDSDFIQKAVKIALRCILRVNSHLSGF